MRVGPTGVSVTTELDWVGYVGGLDVLALLGPALRGCEGEV